MYSIAEFKIYADGKRSLHSRLLCIMRLTVVILLATCLSVSASGYTQKINFDVRGVSIENAFKIIERQSGCVFFYDLSLLPQANPVSAKVKNASLKEALEKCFENQPFIYNVVGRTIVVKPRPEEKSRRIENPFDFTGVDVGIDISGIVSDLDNKPLEGATISVKNTKQTVVSGKHGGFTLKGVEKNAVLIVSYVGYETQEVKVGDQKIIQVKLKLVEPSLKDVVVIGYGSVAKKDLTGSVVQVDVKDLTKAPVPTFDQALAGRVAGVQVRSNEGQPGANTNITIRGGNSLTQSNNPLYVIDGFPIEDFSSSSLNPEDIESISVLKDASATAIYGSRGANGVIIIETKKGKIGKPVVAYNGYYGIQQLTKKMEMMNPYEFVKYQVELLPQEMTNFYLTKPGKTLEDYRQSETIDWQSLLFRNAGMHNHDLSVRGGTATTKYAFSGSYIDQDGIIINSGFGRRQLRASIEQTINKKLKTNLNINYSRDKNYGALASELQSSSNSYASYLMYRTLGYRPVANDVDLITELLDPEDENALFLLNPLISTRNEIREESKADLLMNLGIVYNISKELTVNIRGGYNNRLTKSKAFYNSQTYKGIPSSFNLKGINGTFDDNELVNWVNENSLTYAKRVNKDHFFNITSGFTIQGTNNERFGFESTQIANESLGIRALELGIPTSVRSVITRNAMMSFLGRANYNYKSKYLFTGSLRADGSSKFTKANRWGIFPSGAFAWQMGKEKFLLNSRVINEAKLRLSYGVTGNNRINDFARFQTVNISDYYSFGNETPIYAAEINSMGNQKLKWEKTVQFDVGYDISLLKNRVNLTIDYYNKVTSDLLLNSNVPLATGFSTVYKNVGRIRNNGLELSLNTVNIRGKDFSWESDFNISFNRNKILDLAEGQDKILSSVSFTGDYNASYLYVAQVGGPAAAIYGYLWDGNYQYEDFNAATGGAYVLKQGVSTNGNSASVIKPGDIKYVDLNNDGVVNESDMVVIGRALPIYYGGLNNNFTYKGFSLNVFFQWSYGNDIVNANRTAFEGNFANRANLNQFAAYENRWTPENPTNENFRVGGFGPKGRYSDKLIEDGSFLRLKTVQLAYSFPKRLLIKGFSALETYVSSQNLYTWTNYSGYDPEVSVRNTTLTPGFDYSSYPRNLTLTFGVKATF